VPRSRNHGKTGRPVGRPAMVNVELTTQHNINGHFYGPGVVRVDENVAATLREQENNCRQYDRYMLGGGAGIIIPGRNGGTILQPVAPDFFDGVLGAANPRIRVSGR